MTPVVNLFWHIARVASRGLLIARWTNLKDKGSLLAFYDFPAEHWQHIRTTNPIESVFASVRLRTTKSKSCGSRKTTLAMTYKLMTTAENKWRRLRGYRLLADVVQGIKFKDGERVELDQQQGVA